MKLRDRNCPANESSFGDDYDDTPTRAELEAEDREASEHKFGIGQAYAGALLAIRDNDFKELKDILDQISRGTYEYTYTYSTDSRDWYSPPDVEDVYGEVGMPQSEFILGDLPKDSWEAVEDSLNADSKGYGNLKDNLLEAALSQDVVSVQIVEYLANLVKGKIDPKIVKFLLSLAEEVSTEHGDDKPYLALLKIFDKEIYQNRVDDLDWLENMFIPFLVAIKSNRFTQASQLLAKSLSKYRKSIRVIRYLSMPASDDYISSLEDSVPIMSTLKKLLNPDAKNIYEAIAFWRNPKAELYLILNLNEHAIDDERFANFRAYILKSIRKYVAPYRKSNRDIANFFDLIYNLFQNPSNTGPNSERMKFTREYGFDPMRIVSYKNPGDQLWKVTKDFFSKLGYSVGESLKKSIINSLYRL